MPSHTTLSCLTSPHAGVHPPAAEPPRPLRRAVPPAAPYPVDALGPALADAARALQARSQAPLALCGQAVLAAAAVAAQGHGDVLLPDGDQRPLSLALLSVAEAGERLDAVEARALRAVRAEERRLYAEHPVNRVLYKAERAAWLGSRSAGADRGREALRKRLHAAGPEPLPPRTPTLLVGGASPEGLFAMLASGRACMGWFGAAPAALTGGRAATSASRRSLAGTLTTLWDDGSLDRRQPRDGVLRVSGKRVTVHFAVPPGDGLAWLASPDLADERLSSRLLCVMPDSTIGARRAGADPAARIAAAEAGLDRYDARLRALLRRAEDLFESHEPALRLSPDAERLWWDFRDSMDAESSAGGKLAGLRALAGTAAEHVARLAGVLSVYAAGPAQDIAADAVAGAVRLMRHYLGEAARIAATAGERAELRRAQDVLDHLRRVGRPVVHLADVYQSGPAHTRDAAAARAALRLLEAHGHVVAIPGGAVIDGTPRGAAWRLVDVSHSPLPDGQRSGRAADRVRGPRATADASHRASPMLPAPPHPPRAATSPRRGEVKERALAMSCVGVDMVDDIAGANTTRTSSAHPANPANPPRTRARSVGQRPRQAQRQVGPQRQDGDHRQQGDDEGRRADDDVVDPAALAQALHDIEVDADRRRDHGQFHQDHDQHAEPDRVVAGLEHDGRDDRHGGHHHR
jgi:hypothetical protein